MEFIMSDDVEDVLETVKEMELVDVHLLIEGVNARRDSILKETRNKMAVGDTVSYNTRRKGKKDNSPIKVCGTITKKVTNTRTWMMYTRLEWGKWGGVLGFFWKKGSDQERWVSSVFRAVAPG